MFGGHLYFTPRLDGGRMIPWHHLYPLLNIDLPNGMLCSNRSILDGTNNKVPIETKNYTSNAIQGFFYLCPP